jgi:hypothetical protein
MMRRGAKRARARLTGWRIYHRREGWDATFFVVAELVRPVRISLAVEV